MKAYLKKAWLQIRRLNAKGRVCPDFIIVGAQKCGTTSLYAYMCQHPQVMPGLIKEVHFFDLNYNRGIGWYRAHFPLKREIARQEQVMCKRVITGEATPYYIFHPHAPRRMAETLPNAKLILLLRNPVKRAFSHYNHNRRKGREPLDFGQAVDREEIRLRGEMERMLADESYQSYNYQHFSYVRRGIYIEQIMRYKKFFAPEQLLIIKSEDLFGNPILIFRQIRKFLELDEYVPRNMHPANTGNYSKSYRPDFDTLQRIYAPHNQRLSKEIKRDLGW